MAKLNVVVPAVDVTIDGTVYVKVEREATVGDVVKIISGDCGVTNGGFYEVTHIDARVIDDDGDEYDTYGDEFEVYAKVTAPARLKVGDYAKVRNYPSKYMANGTIVKVTENDRAGKYAYRAVTVNGVFGDIFLAEQLVKVSAEEIKEAELASKWAAIGRKVNEFKVGDLTRHSSVTDAGIAEVTEVDGDHIRVKYAEKTRYGKCRDRKSSHILVTPVEQRFDR